MGTLLKVVIESGCSGVTKKHERNEREFAKIKR